jgi:hypothetical protein
MFATSKKNPVEQNALNVKARQLSSNEQARPLPMFGGTMRLGTTYIENAFGWNTIASKQGAFVFASWVLAVCTGPVDMIFKEIWDDEIKNDFSLAPLQRTGGAFVQAITSPHDQGDLAVFYGTDTQTPSARLATYRQHPAYRNQCYARYFGVFIGHGRNTLPNVEFILGRWPKPAWWTAPVDGDGYPRIGNDINPVAFLAELFQHPLFGLGLPDGRLDLDSWNDAAQTLADEGIGISPLVTRRQGIRQILADIFAIIDAHLYPLANGKIGLNLIRSPGGGLAALDESKWIGGVELDPDGWAETINALNIAYLDAEDNYNTGTAQFIDRGNFEVTGSTRGTTLQRPFITSQALAQKVALSQGARMALPLVKGSLKCRKSVGKLLVPGTAFTLTSAEQGLAAVTMRVKEQTLPEPKKGPEVGIAFERDFSYLNADYYAPMFTPPAAAGAGASRAPMLAMEWPWMRENNVPMVALLSGRLAGGASFFFAHKQWPSGVYELVDTFGRFALHGVVADANYPATDVIDGGLGLVVALDTFDTTIDNVPLSDALLDEWLVILPGSAGWPDEICSAFGATLLSAGKYRLYLVRGRFDTARVLHAIGDEVWVVRKADLVLASGMDEMVTQGWKLQQMIDGELEDLGGLIASTFDTTGRFYRPIEPGNLAAFGDGVNPTYTTGQDVPLTWTVRSERAAGYWDLLEPGWAEELPDTVLEFWTVGGGAALVKTVEITLAPAGSFIEAIDHYEVANGDLVAWLGGEVDFEARAYHRRNGFRSARYRSLVVRKV